MIAMSAHSPIPELDCTRANLKRLAALWASPSAAALGTFLGGLLLTLDPCASWLDKFLRTKLGLHAIILPTKPHVGPKRQRLRRGGCGTRPHAKHALRLRIGQRSGVNTLRTK